MTKLQLAQKIHNIHRYSGYTVNEIASQLSDDDLFFCSEDEKEIAGLALLYSLKLD